MKRLLSLVSLLSIALLSCAYFAPQPSFASVIPTPGTNKSGDRITQLRIECSDPTTVSTACFNENFVSVFWRRFIQFGGFAAAVAIVIVMYAGIQYSLARGDAKKIGAAKTMIYQSLLAVALIFMAYTIVTILWSAATELNRGLTTERVRLP